MKSYSVRVSWRYISIDETYIEVEAESAEDAAFKALDIAHDDQDLEWVSEIVDGDELQADEVEELST